jgi:DNA-binding GntR family transcriptional regulator
MSAAESLDAPPDGTGTRGLEDAIARDIHRGALPPGTWLKQIALQDRYRRSRGDVRRALDKLVAQRLVQHVPNSGYRVFALDPERLEHLRQIRLILEGAAAELIPTRADGAAVEALRRLATGFEEAVRHGSVLDQNQANQAFHAGLLSLCPNPELAQLILETRRRMPSAPLTQWASRSWIEDSVRHHHEMVAALAAGDHAGFVRLVRAHIRLPAPLRENPGGVD